jgi:hypothetical protein
MICSSLFQYYMAGAERFLSAPAYFFAKFFDAEFLTQGFGRRINDAKFLTQNP